MIAFIWKGDGEGRGRFEEPTLAPGRVADHLDAIEDIPSEVLVHPDAVKFTVMIVKQVPGRPRRIGVVCPVGGKVMSRLARVEWEHIQRVLEDCEGNVSKAARVLGIHRRSLQRKLAKNPPPVNE